MPVTSLRHGRLGNARKTGAALSITAMLIVGLAAPVQSEPPATFRVISPIFSQLVTFSMPSGFVAVFENTNGSHYIREAVPKGETAERWTQMITVTGEKGLAASANATPEKFADSIAGGFRRACPDSFAAKALGDTRFGGASAFVGVIGCGNVENHSETALIAVIAGTADYYTVQWAERGTAAAHPPIEDATWNEHLRALQPIALCAIVPGERAPYPSCVDKLR